MVSDIGQLQVGGSPQSIEPLALVVDDDPAALLIAEAALSAAGFAVQQAADGEEALQAFEVGRPDIVLLDIVMPGLDGFEVCRAIRERPGGSATPVIVMTALNDSESVQRAYDLGATDFITKPVNAVLLGHRAHYVLRTHRHYVHFDDLTGLPKRGFFLEQLGRVLARVQRHDRMAALLLIGLDNFDRVNEAFGHVASDRVLREIAQRVTQVVRPDDLSARNVHGPAQRSGGLRVENSVGRLDGAEFAVAINGIRSASDAGAAAKRILQALAELEVEGQTLSLPASIGISLFPTDAEEPQTLLKQAGTAMRHARTHGRDHFQFYAEPLNTQTRRRFSIEAELRRALGRDEFALDYQPQVDLERGTLIGAEALVRWNNADLGAVPPGEFIPIAEETGLVCPLTEWIVHNACRYAAECHQKGVSGLKIAVNLSAVHFRDQRLAVRLAELVNAAGLAPEFVKLELTETALFGDMNLAIRTLNELRERGFELAVDDFGTGYSSLNYLTQLPIGTLKIDQSFVRRSTLSKTGAALVKAIIGLGRTLDYTIIAEGIESIDQLNFLARSGCDAGQGFVFSRPLGGEDFLTWARSREAADEEKPEDGAEQPASADGEPVVQLVQPKPSR